MVKIVWFFVVFSVVLATGLFYSLAIESIALFRVFAALLVVLAIVQWLVLSRRSRRTPDADADRMPRGRS